MTRHYVSQYEDMLSTSNLLTESDSNFANKKQEAVAFSNKFKQFDQRDRVKIKVGEQLAFLSVVVAPGENSRIELSGSVQPKTIAKIHTDNNDKIDFIEFEDGTKFPEAAEFTTVGGTNITNTIFFQDAASAEKAHTSIWMQISNMEGHGWEVEHYMNEAKGVVDKNVGKIRKNDVVQTELKPGDRVIGDMGMGRSVFGTVKRIGREHIFMVSNNGEEMAFRPEHIAAQTDSYWTDQQDAEMARRRKFKKEDGVAEDFAGVAKNQFVKGDLVNHPFFPAGGTVMRIDGSNVYVRDNKSHKIFRLSTHSLLQGNMAEAVDVTEMDAPQTAKITAVQGSGDQQKITATSTDATTGTSVSTTTAAKNLVKGADGKLALNLPKPGQTSSAAPQQADPAIKPGADIALNADIHESRLKKLAGL